LRGFRRISVELAAVHRSSAPLAFLGNTLQKNASARVTDCNVSSI
jgi:hypothetical protein